MWEQAVKAVHDGGVAVIPTDTVYGIVADAHNMEAVARLYSIKGRDSSKPLIVLIPDIPSLNDFDVTLNEFQQEKVSTWWPGPVSVVLDSPTDTFSYIHRGRHTIAFRIPNDNTLRDFLKKTGPLVAPSANPEGELTARTISEAQEYFKDAVDVYVDGGSRKGLPSTLILLCSDSFSILRQGSGIL